MIPLSFPPFIPIFTVTPNLFTPLRLQHIFHTDARVTTYFPLPSLLPFALRATFIRYDYIYRERRGGGGEGRKKLANSLDKFRRVTVISFVRREPRPRNDQIIRPRSFFLFLFSVLNGARRFFHRHFRSAKSELFSTRNYSLIIRPSDFQRW